MIHNSLSVTTVLPSGVVHKHSNNELTVMQYPTSDLARRYTPVRELLPKRRGDVKVIEDV